MQTNKWCYMFSQNSGNVQINDVKKAKNLFKFLINQKQLIKQFLTITWSINPHFLQP